jgi:phospholipase C
VISIVALLMPHSPSSSAKSYSGQPQTPIQHVVIIHKENRSFDNYFGRFPNVNGATTGELHDGTVIPLGAGVDQMPNDIQHSPQAWNTAYNNGEMNGFDLVQGAFSNQGDNLSYTSFYEDQLPNYWAYARRYGLGDNTFHDFKGASYGNNLYRVAAQSGREDPTIGNRAVIGLPHGTSRKVPRWGCDEPADHLVQVAGISQAPSTAYPCFNFKALPNILSDNGVSWHFYVDKRDESFTLNTLDSIAQVRYQPSLWSNVVPLEQFTTDAQNGTLPAVSWIQSIHTEHPNSGPVCDGENESVGYINAVMNSPLWSSTVIMITWDEWGGFYDHVPPPQVDDLSYGFRIPLLVISPWTKYGPQSDGGYVSSVFYSHASLLKFIEVNWDVPSLNSRDAGSNDMMDFFDFDQVPKAPLVLTLRNCGPLSEATRRLMESRTPDNVD